MPPPSPPVPYPAPQEHSSPARFLRRLLRNHRKPLFLGALFGVVCMLAQAFVPAAVGKAVDSGIIARDGSSLVQWSFVVFGLGLLQAVASILSDRQALKSYLESSYATFHLLTRQATRLGAGLSKRMPAGDIVTAGVVDVAQIGQGMEITARGAGAGAAIVVVASVMLIASWQLGLAVLVGVPLMAWVIALLIRPLHGRQEELRDQQGELMSRAIDIVSGLRVLRGLGGEGVFGGRYRRESQLVLHAGVAVARVEAQLAAARILIPGLFIAFVVWLGAHQVLSGRISAGELVAFYGYTAFLAAALRRATEVADKLLKAYVSAGRVARILALEPELPDTGQLAAAPGPTADLVEPESAMTIRGNRLTVVACASASDAGLLADRLGRYVDSTATYGGVPLAAMPLGEVRRRIHVTVNDDRFFSGSLRDELDPTDSSGDAEASFRRAVDTACARDIIDGLADGAEGHVTNAGRDFSGGEQQRLRLVRALMADPETLLLVDPTSAVDAHTEARIASNLAVARQGRTTVVFSLSPHVLAHADHVIYVEDSKALFEGSHTELLKDSRYRFAVTREAAI
ncbi:ABC transporter transmembrane domain-containing protein [Streptomyces sp. NPDC099050]|uniref:ABC transporter transmembrane domain-containing protein n=1 Tax=Streptomyces sp. NPDC099050 TaxID=3366100 RepID=UPI003822CE72